MSIEDFYTETVKIVTVTNPGAFSTSAKSESCSTAKAAVNPVSGMERFAGGHNDVFADYKLFCSDTVTLTESNRVLYGSDYYNVVFVKDTLNMGHHKLAYLKKDVR